MRPTQKMLETVKEAEILVRIHKTHVVVFDQGSKECPFFIDPISRHREMRRLMQTLSYKWVYTDLFTGSEEACNEFIENHKLRR